MYQDPTRSLYLVCYDVSHPRRLRRVHQFLRGYRVGGQKSLFECWLTQGELQTVRSGLQALLVMHEDRAHIFQLDPRQPVRCLGVAKPPHAGAFFIL